MAEIVIRKRVSLDFLGEEYNESYIVLASVPVKEFDDLQNQIAKLKPGENLSFVRSEVKKRFIEGKIQQSGQLVDITTENVEDLPGEVFIEVFEYITGKISPKS